MSSACVLYLYRFLDTMRYLKIIEDQLRKPSLKKRFNLLLESYPAPHPCSIPPWIFISVCNTTSFLYLFLIQHKYAPYALAEFNQHLARYHQWELKNEDPPRLMSLPFLRMGDG